MSDGVENSLSREVDKIRECQARMKQCLQHVNHQLGVNKDCRHQLERDLANKDHGINIDHTVHQLNNKSGGINLHGGVERVDNHVSDKLIKAVEHGRLKHGDSESPGELKTPWKVLL